MAVRGVLNRTDDFEREDEVGVHNTGNRDDVSSAFGLRNGGGKNGIAFGLVECRAASTGAIDPGATRESDFALVAVVVVAFNSVQEDRCNRILPRHDTRFVDGGIREGHRSQCCRSIEGFGQGDRDGFIGFR